jgi:hypothetical protein
MSISKAAARSRLDLAAARQQSGNGRERGDFGFEEFLEAKAGLGFEKAGSTGSRLPAAPAGQPALTGGVARLHVRLMRVGLTRSGARLWYARFGTDVTSGGRAAPAVRRRTDSFSPLARQGEIAATLEDDFDFGG